MFSFTKNSLLCVLVFSTPLMGFELVEKWKQLSSSIGVLSLTLFDSNRMDPHDQKLHRELSMRVWYKAQDNPEKDFLQWGYDKRKWLLENASQDTHIPSGLLEYTIPRKVRSKENLLPMAGPFPVVFLLHGLGGSSIEHHTDLAETLADQGFVVVGIDFPFGSVVSKISQTESPIKVSPLLHEIMSRYPASKPELVAYRKEEHALWVKDIEFVFQTLKEKADGIFGQIAWDKLHIVGHSHGGMVALDTCLKLPQCESSINMDGFTYDVEFPQDLKNHFLIYAKSTSGENFEKFCQDKLYCKSIEVSPCDPGHNGFTDLIYVKWPLTYFTKNQCGSESEKMKNWINHQILKFLQSKNPIEMEKPLQHIADNFLKKHKQAEHFSGLSLTVSHPGISQPVSVYSGYTELRGKEKVSRKHLFQIGSITKSFVSTLLIKLEADPNSGAHLHETLGKFLPQYPQWKNTSIKQLLNMTSGIPDYIDEDPFLKNLAIEVFKMWDAPELLQYVENKPLLFPPGTKWHYSNSNYILAGMVLEKATGKSLKELLEEHFFTFLPDTFYVLSRLPPDLFNRMVHGYHYGGNIGKFFPLGKDITVYNLSYAQAAGGILSTTEDIMHWVKAFTTPNRILPTKQLEKLFSLVSQKTGKPIEIPEEKDPDGFGLGVGKSYIASIPEPVINFAGSPLGFRTFYFYLPKKDIFISAALNSAVPEEKNHLLDLVEEVYQYLSTNKT